MRDFEDRARTAYFRRFGDDVPMPSVSADETEGVVELYNVNGVLGAYRITPDGTLRWDGKAARRLQREHDRIRRKRIGKGWDPARIIDYRPGRKTADEIEADVARREVEPKAEPAGMREEDFFGTSRKLHTNEEENQR